uniref:C-type lectin domain-containing protein n=1 Tax=Seriola dumerili TaxID=41447 RepID=A0A3B4UP08_SERDU
MLFVCESLLLLPIFAFNQNKQCEPGWDKFHGFCYRHFSQRLSWEVAEQHCRMQGAHLVSIMTPEEQNYINSRFTVPTVCGHSNEKLTLIFGDLVCVLTEKVEIPQCTRRFKREKMTLKGGF